MFFYSHYHEPHSEVQLKQHLSIFICATGTLQEWSLVIYGTAEQPYRQPGRRARAAVTPVDSDLNEEYAGESQSGLVSSCAFFQHRPLTQQLISL